MKQLKILPQVALSCTLMLLPVSRVYAAALQGGSQAHLTSAYNQTQLASASTASSGKLSCVASSSTYPSKTMAVEIVFSVMRALYILYLAVATIGVIEVVRDDTSFATSAPTDTFSCLATSSSDPTQKVPLTVMYYASKALYVVYVNGSILGVVRNALLPSYSY